MTTSSNPLPQTLGPRADSVPIGCSGLPSDRSVDVRWDIRGHDVAAGNRGRYARAIPSERWTSGRTARVEAVESVVQAGVPRRTGSERDRTGCRVHAHDGRGGVILARTVSLSATRAIL